MSESVVVATNADGRLELFALTEHLGRGVVAHKWQRVRVRRPLTPSVAIFGNVPPSGSEAASTDPVNWTAWKYRGKPEDSPDLKEIAVAPNANGRLELFGVDNRGAVYSTWQGPSGSWTRRHPNASSVMSDRRAKVRTVSRMSVPTESIAESKSAIGSMPRRSAQS